MKSVVDKSRYVPKAGERFVAIVMKTGRQASGNPCKCICVLHYNLIARDSDGAKREFDFNVWRFKLKNDGITG